MFGFNTGRSIMTALAFSCVATFLPGLAACDGNSGFPDDLAAQNDVNILPDTYHDVLQIIGPNGSILAKAEISRQKGWCLYWNHSVSGQGVVDCYIDDLGQMVLHRSYLPDFAAGLDHIPGRGIQTSAPDGGYWIEDIDEKVSGNAYFLRVGSLAVNHRIVTDHEEINLSRMAQHQRVTIRLISGD